MPAPHSKQKLKEIPSEDQADWTNDGTPLSSREILLAVLSVVILVGALWLLRIL